MATWQEVVDSEPEFAERVRARMDAHRHKTIATVRRDGSPRISGIEVSVADGQMWLGSMSGSRKGADLRRDPRFALHSASVDPPEDQAAWPGDAKISGRVEEIRDPAAAAAALARMGAPEDLPAELFRCEIEEVVLIRVGDPADHLVIELWKPGRPLRRFQRY